MWFVTPDGKMLVNLNHYATISVHAAEGGEFVAVVASNPVSKEEIALLNVPSEEDGVKFIEALAEGLKSGSSFYQINVMDEEEENRRGL